MDSFPQRLLLIGAVGHRKNTNKKTYRWHTNKVVTCQRQKNKSYSHSAIFVDSYLSVGN